MSRIGKKPIEIPEGVEVTLKGGEIKVLGPKGELRTKLPQEIKVEVFGKKLTVAAEPEAGRTARSLWGLTRALVRNMIEGVTKGFKKELELSGIGYRAEKKGEGVALFLGFSHPVEVTPPNGVTLEVFDKTKIAVLGVDKQLVGETAAKLRSLKPPEPYKGKGVKYVDEVIRKKAGKAGKSGAGAFGPPGK